MGLSTPQTIFGVHSFTFFNRTTKLPLGIIKVLGSVNINLSASFTDLFGGSSRYAWDSEPGVIDTTIALNTKEFHQVLYSQCLGASVTENAAETSGNVGTLTNQNGDSVMDATTGIATATAKSGSESDLKDGLYVVKAVSATTVDVYCLSDVDFDTGTDKTFEDDDLKITASALTITASTAVEIPGFGVELNGGSGTIGMTTGDTAYFWVRKINAGNQLITVGGSTQTFSEFGCLWTAQKKGNADTVEIYVPRAKAIGLPLQMNEAAWATADINMKALRDSTENCVFKKRIIKGA